MITKPTASLRFSRVTSAVDFLTTNGFAEDEYFGKWTHRDGRTCMMSISYDKMRQQPVYINIFDGDFM
jgi:hypothetical protein